MSDGFPSMTALLGLVALAGYQNRDKIAEMLGSAGGRAQPTSGPSPRGAEGGGPDLGRVLGGVGGTDTGSFLNGGLGEMLARFT